MPTKMGMNLFSRKHDENELYSLDEPAQGNKPSRSLKRLLLAEGALLQRAAAWIETSYVHRILGAVLMLILVMIVLGFFLVISVAMNGAGGEPAPVIHSVSLAHLDLGL